jgi:hypothetical protein
VRSSITLTPSADQTSASVLPFAMHAIFTTTGPQAIAGVEGVGAYLNHTGTGNVLAFYAVDAEISNMSASGTMTYANAGLFLVDNTSGGSITRGVGVYSMGANFGAGTVALYQGFYAERPSNSGGGTFTTNYGFFAATQVGSGGTIANSYPLWFDETGVFNVTTSSAFNSVVQAIPALHNPQFTKFTAGAANYERVALQWESNVATLTTEKGGTGTLRALNLGDTSVQVKVNSQNLTLGGAFTTTPANSLTFTTVGATNVTLPTSGTLLANPMTGPITINEAVGSSALTLVGATQTSSFPVLTMTQTWNNAGTTFTGALLNITSTASADASLLLDLQVASASKFNVTKAGQVTADRFVSSSVTGGAGTPQFEVGSGRGIYSAASTILHFAANSINVGSMSYDSGTGFGGLQVGSTFWLGWTSSSEPSSNQADTRLYRDAANVIGFRNSTSAQIASIYNTFTSTTSFERLMLDWATTANVAMIYTQKGSGGGTARVLQLNYGGTTTSALSIPITSGAMTFGADPTISGFGAVIYNTGTVSLTGQTADSADTALTINGTGLYSVTYYLLTTTADAAAGTVKLAIKYTDDSGAKEIDSNAVILTATTGFDAGGPITVRTNSGTVTYGTTHTGIYGTSAYALYIAIEKLN